MYDHADMERRNTLRASILVPVVEEYLATEQQVTAVNISEHGMQYRRPVDGKSCKGKEVFLTFSLIDRLKPIRVLGWVVYEEEHKNHIDTHVTFMFLPTKEEELIRDFVSANTMQ